MFRRLLSLFLVLALSFTGMLMPAYASSMTAGEALFGGGAQSNDAPSANAENGAMDTVDEDFYNGTVENITDYKSLKLGDRDDADTVAYVVMLQMRLIETGYLKDAADGVYGANTETAVDQFQKFNGLERTGIADPATQAKLFSEDVVMASSDSLAIGSEEVRIQSKLAEWGFLAGTVDGVLGNSSRSAIKSFKEYANTFDPIPTPTPTPEPTPTPTPAPGMLSDPVDELLPTPIPSPTPFAASSDVDSFLLKYVEGDHSFEVFRQSVAPGDNHVEVRRVQNRLKNLNYLYPDADGVFGANTARALMYFQYKNGLPQSGVADEATQRKLFSSSAVASEEYVFPYKLVVDISEQRVYAYKWDGASYGECVKKMTCSTGKNATPTPTGTYQSYGQLSGEWYYFKKYNCYAKWAYGIVGGIFFHSVTYSASKKLNRGSVDNLGRKASHGCIRLTVENAKWIYDNCPYGTTVVIKK